MIYKSGKVIDGYWHKGKNIKSCRTYNPLSNIKSEYSIRFSSGQIYKTLWIDKFDNIIINQSKNYNQIIYKNGNRYEGELKGERNIFGQLTGYGMHGYGQIIFKDGRMFRGNFDCLNCKVTGQFINWDGRMLRQMQSLNTKELYSVLETVGN